MRIGSRRLTPVISLHRLVATAVLLVLVGSVPAPAHNVLGLRIADLDRRIAADPDNPRLRLGRAGLYLALDDPDRAEPDLVAVLRRMPGHIEATRLLAAVCLDRHDPERALDLLERLPASAGKEAKIVLPLAEALVQTGRPELARQRLLQQARRPDAPAAVHLRLARLDIAQGRHEAAALRLARLLGNQPDHGEAAGLLAGLHAAAGRWSRAMGVIDDALAAGAEPLPLRIARAELQNRMPEAAAEDGPERAAVIAALRVAAAERIEWNEGEVAGDFVLRARVRLLAGQPAAARRDLDRALRLSPRLSAARKLRERLAP